MGAAAGTVASPEAGGPLCIHGASRGAEVSGACSLLSRSLQSPAEEGKTTTALGEAAARRPRSGLLSAPSAATCVNAEVRSVEMQPAPWQAARAPPHVRETEARHDIPAD